STRARWPTRSPPATSSRPISRTCRCTDCAWTAGTGTRGKSRRPCGADDGVDAMTDAVTDAVTAPEGSGWVSPLLAVPGAVAAEGADAGVAWHYGDPLREQRTLESGVGTVDLSHRGVVRVAGPDRLSWLHSLTSQALDGLPPHTSTETLVLSPHGHIEHDLHLVDDGEAVWASVEPGTAGALGDWVGRGPGMLR